MGGVPGTSPPAIPCPPPSPPFPPLLSLQVAGRSQVPAIEGLLLHPTQAYRGTGTLLFASSVRAMAGDLDSSAQIRTRLLGKPPSDTYRNSLGKTPRQIYKHGFEGSASDNPALTPPLPLPSSPPPTFPSFLTSNPPSFAVQARMCSQCCWSTSCRHRVNRPTA